MGLLDGFMDPNTQGLLAAAGALGQAGMPSRMPVPLGAALGSAASAMGQGYQAAARNQAQTALLGQEYQKNLLGNAQALMRMRFMAQRHPEMFSPAMLDQMSRLAGVPTGTAPAAAAPGGVPPSANAASGSSAVPAGAPAVSASAPSLLQGGANPSSPPVASTAGGLFNPQTEGDILDAEFMGFSPQVIAMSPALARQKFLATNGYLPNGQIDPRYVAGQGSLEAAKAAGSAPYKALESLLSRAGQVHNIGPGEVGVTGFQTMPPAIQSLVGRLLQGNALPGGEPSPALQPRGAVSTAGAPAGGVGTNPTGFPVQGLRGPGGSFQNPITLEGKTLQTEVLPEQYKQAASNYGAAQDVSARLDMMDHAIDQLNQAGWSSTGAGANLKMGALKALNSMATTLGASPFADPQKIATWEDFNKESTRMGFELAKTLGSREAMMIVQQATAAVPNASNTYLGAKLVSSSLRQAAQRQEDYYEFLNNYAQSHGGNTMGADVAFNKLHPPKEYTSRAIVNAIPQGAVQALQADPKLADQFDAKYGPGVSRYVLGK